MGQRIVKLNISANFLEGIPVHTSSIGQHIVKLNMIANYFEKFQSILNQGVNTLQN